VKVAEGEWNESLAWGGGGVKGVNWNEGQQKWEVAEFCGDLRLSAGF